MTRRRPGQSNEIPTQEEEVSIVHGWAVGTLASTLSSPLLVPHVNNLHSKSPMNQSSFFSSSSSRETSSSGPKQGMAVHFSRVLQIREVQHRKDMSPLELQERWGLVVVPSITRNIFDEHVLVQPESGSSATSTYSFSSGSSFWCKEKVQDQVAIKRRRRHAYLIRRKVLSDIAHGRHRHHGGLERGDDDENDNGGDHDSLATVVARNYSQNSQQNVREAHIAALKHAHEVAVDEDDEEDSSSLSARRKKDDPNASCNSASGDEAVVVMAPSSSALPAGGGSHHHSKVKRVAAGNHPLAAVKRLRNTI